MYITKNELAKIFAISIPTINRWMAKGMPYYKMGKRMVRFKEIEVKEWLQKGG